MHKTPQAILRDFILDGRLDPHSSLEVISETEVTLLIVRATSLRHGTGRTFLLALRDRGYRVHILHPAISALPFWREMFLEGLIADDPNLLQTWEDFIGSIESEMSKEETSKATYNRTAE